MPIKAIFRRSDSLYLRGFLALHNEASVFNPVTEVEIILTAYPGARADRWNGGTGIRAATAAEITDFDTTKAAEEVASADAIRRQKRTDAITAIDSAVLGASGLPEIKTALAKIKDTL